MMRERLAGLAVVGAFAFAVAPPGPAAPATLAAPSLQADASDGPCGTAVPYRLRSIGPAEQVVVVTSKSWGATHVRVRTYEVRDGDWCKVRGPVPGRVGWSGMTWARDRRQGSGETPAGTFDLVWAFGNAADPGTSMRYRSVDSNDWWAYDPRSPETYNRWLEYGRGEVRPGWGERLESYGRQYAHSVVLDYNLPSPGDPANTRKGGGIFLHVNGPGATAGCVSVPKRDLVSILRWLDPDRSPVIVVAPKDRLHRA